MSPQDYAISIKEKYGTKTTRDGQLIRDMNDQELVRRMVERYPDDAAQIQGLDEFLGPAAEEVKKTIEPYQSPVSKKLNQVFKEFGTGTIQALKNRKASADETVIRRNEGEISTIPAIAKVAGEGAGAIGDTAFEAIKSVVPEGVKKGVGDVVEAGAEAVMGTDTAQTATKQYEDWKKAHPDAAATLEGTLNLGALIPGFGAGKLGITGAKKAGEGVVDATKKVARDTAEFVAKPFTGTAKKVDETVDKAKNIRSRVQAWRGSKNVAPQLSESALRLGEKKAKKPVETYEEFSEQEKRFKKDIKADTSLGLVGERIGKSFDDVVKQRKDAGAMMGEELKKIGNVKTNIAPTFKEFGKNLLENENLNYDGDLKKLVPTSKQTKMTKEDIGLLETYIKDLEKLGPNPTIGELDAFMKRVPQELDVAKAAKNMMTVTNGERLIKGHLTELRKQFDPETTKNPELKKYSEARNTYSELSRFLEEGVGFLGKKTQDGDYAKDASIAKSSVQSILNSGKKDWLAELEALTGYQALDESLLAIQAMNDAGNFRGASLLEKITDGDIPTSKAGVVMKLLDWGLKKSTGAFSGTPEQQTKAFLKSLETEK